MIVDVASDKLAICHWTGEGQRREGVFEVCSLVWCRTGQQIDLWPELLAALAAAGPGDAPPIRTPGVPQAGISEPPDPPVLPAAYSQTAVLTHR